MSREARIIAELNPVVGGLARRFIDSVLNSDDLPAITITEGVRSLPKQLAYHLQGRASLPEVNRARKVVGLAPIVEQQNRIITYAQPGDSLHNYGCAFDVAFIREDGGLTWDGPWDELGAIAESIGLKWGGRFRPPDRPHFQYTGGLTLAQLKQGERPEEVTNG